MAERYSLYPAGMFIEVPGNLGKDLEVKRTNDGKRYVKIDIATPAGSKKNGDDYENVTDWNSVTVWDNGGNSKLFIDHIENPPSEKVKFYKGNSVVLRAFVSKNVRMYEGKAYCDLEVKEFLHLSKVMQPKPKEAAPVNNDYDGF